MDGRMPSFAPPASVGIFLGALLALTVIFGWLFLRQKRRYLGLWALVYLLLAGSYAASLFVVVDPLSPDICGLCAGMVFAMLLTLMAVADFTGDSLSVGWTGGAVATLAVLASGQIVPGWLDGYTSRSLVTHVYVMAVGLYAPWLLWRHGGTRSVEVRLAASVMLVTNLHSCLHPFLPYLGAYVAPGWIIESSLVVFTGTTMLLCHFRRMEEELSKAERQRKALEDEAERRRRLESLAVMAGGVAHDFNNLLASILGSADLVAMDLPEGSRSEKDLARIRRAALRASDLTRQLLAASGQGDYHFQALDLGTLVRETVHVLEVTGKLHVEVQVHEAAGPVWVEGDQGQLDHLLLALFQNAVEALGPSRSPIEVEIEKDGQLNARVRIRDRGEGLDEETASRAMEPFFSTRFTGRGLGLSAAAGIARRHRGRLELTGTPGEGATATLVLPLCDPPPLLPPLRPRTKGVEAERRLLLVEDDEDLREVLRVWIEERGWTLDEAVDGREALRLLEDAERYRLVLLDWKMPHLSGDGVLREMTARGLSTPVILMSGFSEGDATRAIREVGTVRSFLQKPFTHEALARRLEPFELSGGSAD